MASLIVVLCSSLSFSASPLPITQHTITRDPALTITAQDLNKKIGANENITLIDIRPAEEFEKIKIPNSYNMPLHVIKTKKHLRLIPLIIINSGVNYRSLETECKRLLATFGFKGVKILQGGLNSWHHIGGALTGSLAAAEKLDIITSRDYYVDKSYKDWIVINASASGSTISGKPFPSADHIPFKSRSKRFLKQVKKAITSRQDISYPYILIFNETGQNYAPVRKTLQHADIGNVFFLQGGLDAYTSYAEKVALQRNPRTIKTSTCEACP